MKLLITDVQSENGKNINVDSYANVGIRGNDQIYVKDNIDYSKEFYINIIHNDFIIKIISMNQDTDFADFMYQIGNIFVDVLGTLLNNGYNLEQILDIYNDSHIDSLDDFYDNTSLLLVPSKGMCNIYKRIYRKRRDIFNKLDSCYKDYINILEGNLTTVQLNSLDNTAELLSLFTSDIPKLINDTLLNINDNNNLNPRLFTLINYLDGEHLHYLPLIGKLHSDVIFKLMHSAKIRRTARSNRKFREDMLNHKYSDVIRKFSHIIGVAPKGKEHLLNQSNFNIYFPDYGDDTINFACNLFEKDPASALKLISCIGLNDTTLRAVTLLLTHFVTSLNIKYNFDTIYNTLLYIDIVFSEEERKLIYDTILNSHNFTKCEETMKFIYRRLSDMDVIEKLSCMDVSFNTYFYKKYINSKEYKKINIEHMLKK